jgi:flavin-dependent dehydrogenase
VSDFDLLIVGGGPVGLVTALAARRRGLSAAVIERSAEAPEKACGEGLMPGAVQVLRELGVSLPGAMAFPGIRFVDADAAAAGRFPGQNGLAVSRRDLMLALYERARSSGVALLMGRTLRDFEYRERVLTAHTSSASGPGSFTAPLLVAADGLRSGVRRRLGYELPARRPARFGLQRHYRCAPWTDWVEVHWHDSAEAYVTPLGPDEIGVALLSHGAPAAFDELLQRFPALERRLAMRTEAGRIRGAGPFEQRVRAVLAPGVALVGDAAGYLDALSGEGLALGFASASLLVQRFAAGELWRYPTDHARVTATYQLTTGLMLEFARRPWLRRAAIRYLRGQPKLFTDLLGIAVGSSVPPCSTLGSALHWALLPFLHRPLTLSADAAGV